MVHINSTYYSVNQHLPILHADAVDLPFSVDLIIGYDSWYNITIESSYISLLRSDIHKITRFTEKSKIVVKFKDVSFDRNCVKPCLFGRPSKQKF